MGTRARNVRDVRQLALEMRGAVSEDGDMARRSYGTGALYIRRDARGRTTWYGKWRVGEGRSSGASEQSGRPGHVRV